MFIKKISTLKASLANKNSIPRRNPAYKECKSENINNSKKNELALETTSAYGKAQVALADTSKAYLTEDVLGVDKDVAKEVFPDNFLRLLNVREAYFQNLLQCKNNSLSSQIPDFELDKIKTRAQKEVLPEAIKEFRSAQKFANQQMAIFGHGNVKTGSMRKMWVAAKAAQERSKSQGRVAFIGDERYVSSISEDKDSSDIVLKIKSLDSNVQLTYVANKNVPQDKREYYLNQISMPDKKIWLSNGLVTKIATGIDELDPLYDYAQKFYSMPAWGRNAQMNVCENSSIMYIKNQYDDMNLNVVDSENKFGFDSKDGTLITIENRALKDKVGSNCCYRYNFSEYKENFNPKVQSYSYSLLDHKGWQLFLEDEENRSE